MKQEIMTDNNATQNKPVTLWVRIPLFVFFVFFQVVLLGFLAPFIAWSARTLSGGEAGFYAIVYGVEYGFYFWLQFRTGRGILTLSRNKLPPKNCFEKIKKIFSWGLWALIALLALGSTVLACFEQRRLTPFLWIWYSLVIFAGISFFFVILFGLVWGCCNLKKILFWIGKFSKNKIFWMVFISGLFYVAAIIFVWSVPTYEHCFFLGIFGSLWCAIELQFLLLMKSTKKSSRLAKIYHLAALGAVPVFWWLLAAADVRTENAIALFAPAPYCCVWVIFVLHVQIKKYLKA